MTTNSHPIDERTHEREFVRTFFTTPTAVEAEDDSATMLRSAVQLRGLQAPDVWVKDMRAITPTGELPSWPELRHDTSRAASAAGLIAVDGPFDDIRDVEGLCSCYRLQYL